MSDIFKGSEQLGRKYRQYEPQYNAAFAADPNAGTRRFNETAPSEDIQWKRLEVFRGNDKDAYHAHQSNPHDPLAQPTAKEQKLWSENQADRWSIDREPGFSAHPLSHNKWVDLSPAHRRAEPEKVHAFYDHVEAKHGPNYQAYADKAGNHAVYRDDYLRTMSVVEAESMARGREQPVQQREVQVAPTPQSAHTAPAQQPAQEVSPEQQLEPAQKSRLSLTNFQGSTDAYFVDRQEVTSQKSDVGLVQQKEQAIATHAAEGLGNLYEQQGKVEAYNRVQSTLEEVRQARRQQVRTDVQEQSRGLER
jgi:hypothetical protein